MSVTYTSAGYSVPAFLAARLAKGRPPDVAFLPQPGLLRRYAAEHLLVPLNDIAGSAVASNYSPAWRQLGSVGGRLYGVWFKAANKSLIWYNEGIFERAGVAPPAGIDGLVSLAHRLARSGMPAFSVGGQNGWTLADWFSNLYLRLAGPARYDLLAAHKIAWTDPSVIGHAPAAGQGAGPARHRGRAAEERLSTSYQRIGPAGLRRSSRRGDGVRRRLRGRDHQRRDPGRARRRRRRLPVPRGSGSPGRWWWPAATRRC